MTPERMDNILDAAFDAVFGPKWRFTTGSIRFELEEISHREAKAFGLTLTDLQGNGQTKHQTAARINSVRSMRRGFPEVTLCQMADVLNAKQHTLCTWLRRARQNA